MTTTDTAATRTNEYAGTCRGCKKPVAAGEGELHRDLRNRWVVLHPGVECFRLATRTSGRRPRR